jgi:hypothetical protein
MAITFDAPGVWQDFYVNEVIARTTRGETAFKASVLLNARDTAQMGNRYGDCYSVVCNACGPGAWGLVTEPRRGDILEVDGRLKLYVFQCYRIDSCFHIQAMSRNVH